MSKSKTRMKGILGIVMSLLLLLGSFSVTAFAANNGTITASHIEKGATVKAYKIIQQDSTGDWEAVVEGSIADPTKPTAAEITALANELSGLTAIDMEEGTEITTEDGIEFVNYTKSGLEAGMYLVIVEKADSELVYNPMIISVNYDNNGELEGGNVSAGSVFQVGEEVAYAKSTKPTVDKKITGKPENENVNGDETTAGDTHNVGDEISFEITTTIPAYSDAYDNERLMFEISDTVSDGLDAPYEIVVSDGSGALTDGTEYILEQEGKSFTIKFSRNYLLSGQAKAITVTYKSTLNEDATSGFDANTNTATITYSNTPTSTEDKEKQTYHYTFDIDGNVGGNVTGREIVKVGIDETTGELITKETSETTASPLEGAVFGLFKTDNTKVGEVTTDSAGLMKFTGLDAGEYYLMELKAPAGYKTNSTHIPVIIEATLNSDGTLASYSVTINGQNTTTYTGNYEGEEIVIDNTGDTSLFNNYKAGVLPSTGGNGIYFYIVTGAILIGLAILLYAKSKKTEKKESE